MIYKFTLIFLDFKFLKDSHDEDNNYNNLLLQVPTVLQHETLLTQSTTVSSTPFDTIKWSAQVLKYLRRIRAKNWI